MEFIHIVETSEECSKTICSPSIHDVQTIEPTTCTLILEPFFGGSHKQLIDLLCREFSRSQIHVFNLPAKKWHWRARVSALYFAQNVPKSNSYRTLFASSVLNLCELCALRPDLAALHKVIYFHENQLEYPVLNPKDRDFQYGYNQITSCLVANRVLFNSRYNMESFLGSIQKFLNQMPDFRPANLEPEVRVKSQVLYFPMEFPLRPAVQIPVISERDSELPGQKPLHIVWPHRWEHDKNPELFFSVLFSLQENNHNFRVSVLGEQFSQVPEVFLEARNRLCNKILAWGFQQSRKDYLDILWDADLVISTSNHEFFGVAMLEAVACKCYPLCPNRLVYPEIFPAEYLYKNQSQLIKVLKRFCKQPHLIREHEIKVDLTKYSWQSLSHKYRDVLGLQMESHT